MSKALSANIHDPNHTVDEYDLYFNGEQIETGGSVTMQTIRATAQAPTNNFVSELTFEFTTDYEIPNDAVYISPASPSNTSDNYVRSFTYQGGYNSTTNTCLVGLPTSGGVQVMGASLTKSNHNKTVTLKLSSASFSFYTGQNVEMYCIFPEVS